MPVFKSIKTKVKAPPSGQLQNRMCSYISVQSLVKISHQSRLIAILVKVASPTLSVLVLVLVLVTVNQNFNFLIIIDNWTPENVSAPIWFQSG